MGLLNTNKLNALNINKRRNILVNNNIILKSYIPIVNFIADICGPNYEVVLHDISKPDSSIVAIRNNHITAREIGGPITDLALRILKQKDYLRKDFIANYDGQGKDGKIFLSSTYFIKDEDHKLIGMICVNNDITDIQKIKENYKITLNRFNYREENKKDTEYKETIETPLSSITNSLIEKAIKSIRISPSRMSVDEKVKITHDLDEQGVFLMKGAVSDVANQLKISETTVYRYLNKKNNC